MLGEHAKHLVLQFMAQVGPKFDLLVLINQKLYELFLGDGADLSPKLDFDIGIQPF